MNRNEKALTIVCYLLLFTTVVASFGFVTEAVKNRGSISPSAYNYIYPAINVKATTDRSLFKQTSDDILHEASNGHLEDRFYIRWWTPAQVAELIVALRRQGYIVTTGKDEVGEYFEASWEFAK